MAKEGIENCKRCGGEFLTEYSKKSGLCPDCRPSGGEKPRSFLKPIGSDSIGHRITAGFHLIWAAD